MYKANFTYYYSIVLNYVIDLQQVDGVCYILQGASYKHVFRYVLRFSSRRYFVSEKLLFNSIIKCPSFSLSLQPLLSSLRFLAHI